MRRIVFLAFVFSAVWVCSTGCSVTVGTVNVSTAKKPRIKTEITETKPVTVQTDANVPISALP